MSKILTTQLTGLLQRINQSEEESIEETARLLAQAAIGQGSVYFVCFDELTAVETNALASIDPFKKLVKWTPSVELTSADRICIFSRSGNNPEAVAFAEQLSSLFIPFSAVASEVASDTNMLSELAYTYISLKMRGGILPHPTNLGERAVFPHLIAALFVYEAIKLEYDEMLGDDDDLDEDLMESHPSPFGN